MQIELIPRTYSIPYVENFLTKDEADRLFERIRSMPRVRPTNPRNPSAFIRKVSYGCYSVLPESRTGKTVHGGGANYLDGAPDEIRLLQAKLSAYAGKDVNYLSLLGYENEKDHIGWHQHREDRTLEDQTVWVVSLGEARVVSIRKASDEVRSHWENITTRHGSLYVLPHSFNTTHEHAVLDSRLRTGLRISINCKHIDAKYLAEHSSIELPEDDDKAYDECWRLTPDGPGVYCCRAGCSYPSDAVYVGRATGKWPSTPFGNHKHLDAKTWSAEVDRLMQDPEFRKQVEALLGKNLLCWCRPSEPFCHARLWLELANR